MVIRSYVIFWKSMWSLEITCDTRDGLQTTDPLFLNAAPWNQKENSMQVYSENCSPSAWTNQCEDQGLVTEQLFSQHRHSPFFVSSAYLLSHKWAQVLTVPLVCGERYFTSTLSSTIGNYGNMCVRVWVRVHTNIHTAEKSHSQACVCTLLPFFAPFPSLFCLLISFLYSLFLNSIPTLVGERSNPVRTISSIFPWQTSFPGIYYYKYLGPSRSYMTCSAYS